MRISDLIGSVDEHKQGIQCYKHLHTYEYVKSYNNIVTSRDVIQTNFDHDDVISRERES